jgi:hypothetical protein
MKIVAMSQDSAIFHAEIYSSMVVILFQGAQQNIRIKGTMHIRAEIKAKE